MTLSFRARVLLVVVAVAVLPLALIGLWLTRSAARSGEALLRSRLESALAAEARTIERAWIRYRSALLDLSEEPAVQRVLRGADGAAAATAPATLARRFADLQPAIEGVTLYHRDGRAVLRLGRDQADAAGFLAFGALLTVDVPLYDVASGAALGRLAARVPISALRGASGASAGALITALDPQTGTLLLPAPFDPAVLRPGRFRWNEEDWVALAREVTEPRVDLVAVSPIDPFTVPFRAAARRGTVVLLIAALMGVGAAAVVTARLTRSLEHLATAATDVAAGHLGRRVEVRSHDEVGRVAHAFNAMTDSLRRTLDQLAERESLAAVNEFAAALAHEVRNPLTAIQLDLQEVEERLPADSPLRPLQGRALEDLRRLDRTVAGALVTARSGHIDARVIDLREPVRAAVHAAGPAFAARDARLEWHEPPRATPVRGDADALQRAFLNVLLNAAEACDPHHPQGAHPGATVDVVTSGAAVTVTVRDRGRGIPAAVQQRVFDPFFTTRPGGTGLGLAVARRVVTAHHGVIALHSEPGVGTTVEVTLPLAPATGTT